MADVMYQVGVEYTVAGNLYAGLAGADAKVRDLAGSIGGLERPFARVGSSFASSFGSAIDTVSSGMIDGITTAAAAAGAALAGAVAMATKEGLAFNNTIEKARIGLATVADMNLGVGLDRGMGMAAKAIEEAKKDAARLPGEFKDLMGFMTSAAPAALQRGVSFDRLEKIAANAMAASAALSVPMNVAARQLAMMFEGRITRAQAFGLRLGFQPQEFNKLSDEKRVAAIEAALAKANPAIDLYARSFEGLTSTARDYARQFAGTFAEPLFGSIKSALARGIGWIDANRDSLEATLTAWGVGLANAFEWVVDRTLHWGPILLSFAHRFGDALSAGFERVAPYLRRVESAAERFMVRPDAPDRALDVAQYAGAGLLGVRAVSMLAPTVQGGLAAAGVEMSAALGPLAIVVGSIAGAVHVLTDETALFHGVASESWGRTGESMGRTLEHVEAMARRASPVLIKVADVFGTALVLSLENVVTIAEGLTSVFDKWSGAMSKAYDWIRAALGLMDNDPRFDTRGRPEFEVPASKLSLTALAGLGTDEDVKKHIPKVTINQTNKVEIKISGNQDPGRIAKKVMKEIEFMARHPLTSSNSGNPRLSRS